VINEKFKLENTPFQGHVLKIKKNTGGENKTKKTK
jgi:hypothetical protein